MDGIYADEVQIVLGADCTSTVERSSTNDEELLGSKTTGTPKNHAHVQVTQNVYDTDSKGNGIYVLNLSELLSGMLLQVVANVPSLLHHIIDGLSIRIMRHEYFLCWDLVLPRGIEPRLLR